MGGLPANKTPTRATAPNSTTTGKKRKQVNENDLDSDISPHISKKKKTPTSSKANKALAGSSNTNRDSGREDVFEADDGDAVENQNMAAKIAEMEAALKQSERRNKQLQQQLSSSAPQATGGEASANNGTEVIDKPSGHGWSIQRAMGLQGKGKKYDSYKSIQRSVRDLAMAAQINYEIPWREVPSSQKARLFDVCRKCHPYLARFRNDWATEALAKQFLGNKRQRAYDMGWLDVPEKYAYLKDNAGSRKKKGWQIDVASDSTHKKSKVASGKAARTRIQKGKAKATEFEEDEDEDALEFPNSDEGDSSAAESSGE
ncbi:hypothetical protein HWV62_13243 [Athelia sp. TMB]|nr:hypothetical protein HWV62_13243 [Athelia sp. TMB]